MIERCITFVGLAIVACGCQMAGSSSDSPNVSCALPKDENGVVLNRIPGTETIDIPNGLTCTQALDAVELAINGTSPGERNNSWVSKWRPELRDPDNKWIRIGLHVRTHYLCVCYRVEGNQLVPDVPTSRNLKQNGSSIHRKVPIWINDFKTLIATQMYGLATGSTCVGTKVSTRNRMMKAEARQAEANATIAEAEASRVSAESATPANKFCSECGAKVSDTDKFCSACGKKLK